MIRLATDDDRAVLTDIWKNSFNDDEKTISAFFEKSKGLYTCIIGRYNTEPVAAMYIFDCEYKSSDRTCKAAYLYALATLPQHRGRGVMTELIECATVFLKEKGYEFLFLSPSDESIVGFYEKCGFSPCDIKKCADIPADCILDVPTDIAYLSADTVFVCRERSVCDFVRFDGRYIDLALDFGEAKAIGFSGGYAICDFDGDTVRVIEYGGEVNRMLSAVKLRFKAANYRVYMPSDALFGETVCRGMVKPLCGGAPQNGVHIGLIMD